MAIGTSSRASVRDTKVWQLALLPRMDARGDADRMLTLLGQARVVDDQIGVGAADELSACRANSFSIGARSQIPSEMK